ncbi:MAG: hypothetical protein JST26_12965 [Bacteroidetes bacterium]|nr:hypothetical protein [Bacteroidota bacterium]
MESYPYGFNGKENDGNIASTGEGAQDYGMRIYNPALGKFLSVDPLSPKYPYLTPYQFAGNRPIVAIDVDGLEDQWVQIQREADGTEWVISNIVDIAKDVQINNSVALHIPQLKEGGVLTTVFDVSTGKYIKVEYQPTVIVNPKKTISELLEEMGYAGDKAVKDAFPGSIDNYGYLEGRDGQTKVFKVGHDISDKIDEVPVLGKVSLALDVVLLIGETSRDIEDKNYRTAAARVGGEVVGNVIDKVIDKKLENNSNKEQVKDLIDKAIDDGKEKVIDEAKKLDEGH